MINEQFDLSELDLFIVDQEDEEDIHTRLARKEKYLLLAAKAGNALLERNKELQNECERLNADFVDKIEVYEAEKYRMRKHFIEKESNYQERIQNLSIDNEALTRKLESAERKTKLRRSASGKRIGDLTRHNDILKNELDMATYENKELFLQVQTLKRRIEGRSMSSGQYTEDMLEFKMVNEQVRKLQNENKNLEETLGDLANEKLSFIEESERSKEKISLLEQKAKYLEQQILIAKSELDESKSSNVQLKEQLEEYILQASRASFNASNSLLNELESSLHGENENVLMESKLNDVDDFTPKFMSSPERQNNGMINVNHFNKINDESLTDQQYLENTCSESSKAACLERQIEELNKRLNESNKSYEQLYRKYSAANGQLTNTESKINDMQQQVNFMQRELHMYKQEREIIISRDSFDRSLAISLEERRKACQGESEALLQLEQTKSDMVKLNNQLLEAVQQKLELSEQLELWQVDMAMLIEKQLKKTPGKQENKGYRKSKLFTGRWSWSSTTKSN